MPSLDAKRLGPHPASRGRTASFAYALSPKLAFSLVELVIGIALIATISVVVFSIYISHFKIFSGQSLAIGVASENQIAMDEITNQVREAQAVPVSCSRITCESNDSCFGAQCIQVYKTTGIAVMVLTLWPLDGSGNPVEYCSTCNYTVPDYISYYLESTGDNYYNLIKETAIYDPSGATYVSSRREGKDIIASKIKCDPPLGPPTCTMFKYTPATPNTTEVTITIENAGNALFKPFKPYEYKRTSLARLKNRASSNLTQISFPYAVHSSSFKIAFDASLAQKIVIRGNVFSNSSIQDAQCQGAPSPPNCIIYGEAFATGELEAPPISVVPGPKHAFYTPAVPVPTVDELYWQNQALNGGLTSCPTRCNITDQVNYLLGPRKYSGNLTISNSSVIVKGPVHVTGDLVIQGGSTISLDDSFGSVGTVIITNGSQKIWQSSQVLATSATPKGYILFYNTGPEGDSNITIAYNKPHEAIYYTKGTNNTVEGSVSPLSCNHSADPPIVARLTGAVIGYLINLRGCLEVIDPNLSSATFSP